MSVIDDRVRAAVYEITMRTGRPPTIAELGLPDAAESLKRLAAARILVLQRESGEILMAAPFSAVPTPFRVVAGGISSFANCVWDALGIPAMLHSDAVITTSCGDCGAAMQVHVANGDVSGEGLLHFAVPARQWWDDIVFT